MRREAGRVRITADGTEIGSVWGMRARRAGDPSRPETRLLSAVADQVGAVAVDPRAEAAEHGFMSVKESLERHYPQLVRILRAYDLEVSLDSMREAASAMRSSDTDDEALVNLMERRARPNQPLRVVK